MNKLQNSDEQTIKVYYSETIYIYTILAILAILICQARLHTYYEPLERDICGYALIANELLNGNTLYSGIWDHKPPGAYVAYMIAQMITGYGQGSIYFLTICTALITLIGVYYVGISYSGSYSTGLWAACFWAIISGDPEIQANQPNVEVFMNACLIWAFALFVKMRGQEIELRKTVTIGLLFAMASLYKQIAVVSAFFMAISHLAILPGGANSRKTAIFQILIIAGIGMAAWIGTFAYFVWTGRFNDFYMTVFAYNQEYSGSIANSLINSFQERYIFPYFLHNIFFLLAFSVLGVIIGLWKGHRRLWILYAGFMISTHFLIAMPGRFFAHYYQFWLPVIVVGVAWLMEIIKTLMQKQLKKISDLLGLLIIALLVLQILPLYRHSADTWSKMKYGNQFVVHSMLASELNKLLKPDETFYQWGYASDLYFKSNRRPPTGIFYIMHLYSKSVGPELAKRLVDDLKKSKPTLLMWSNRIPAIPVKGLKEGHPKWMLNEYRFIPGKFHKFDFSCFVRKGSDLEKRLSSSLFPKQYTGKNKK